MKETVILAYSGGLDTSVAIKWLEDKYDLQVVALAADLGQPGDLEMIRRKAIDTGAIDAIVLDLKETFAEEFILPALKANALYEGKYPLATSLGRPLIASVMVEEARRRGASAVAHGCTGKGNDQVRFDVTTMALGPDLKIIAPLREWVMSREEEIEYAREHGIPVPVTLSSPYSVDENLWGRSCEAGILEDPMIEPPEDSHEWTISPEKAPDAPVYTEIAFESGRPVELDGEDLKLVDMIKRLNQLGGSHGIGRIDMIENRLVGIKSRETYEAPAATILIEAHKALESMTLTRETLHFKPILEQKFADLVYYGLWYEPLRSSLQTAIEATQEKVSGKVRLKLFKGNCMVVGRESKYSLYDYSLATYDRADTFSHQASEGFIELWGLPLKVWGIRQSGKGD
ncbi:MAG: argininosuccinate synthase [Candidatus Solincola sediminis]|uniref:Argininosuccinate synthase n=1 Tax=Candidatus Solincola sediminis TaxID=1797199 RepID=A0A1F2WT28_9ACTN|nr:MAG: argininosuccinate synthase [Candidatus Solincola sediminis]OFW60896.1 MAG: argininosuccinate synthase [Candidatus Solincola sediminis]